jgi:hypothetical protein
VDVNDGAETSGNVGPTNNADHSDQGDADSDDQLNDNEGSSGEKRKKLAPHLVEQLYAMDTDTLRDAVRKHGHYTRLVAEDKVKLDDAHEEYLKQVYRICGTNLLKIDSVMKYIGQGNRTRGGTMYSYFCQYNPEAVRIKNDCKLDKSQDNPWITSPVGLPNFLPEQLLYLFNSDGPNAVHSGGTSQKRKKNYTMIRLTWRHFQIHSFKRGTTQPTNQHQKQSRESQLARSPSQANLM